MERFSKFCKILKPVKDEIIKILKRIYGEKNRFVSVRGAVSMRLLYERTARCPRARAK